MMPRLHAGMAALGYRSLTPPEQDSPIATFVLPGDRIVVRDRLKARNISASVGRGYIRVSPSVFNDVNDIEALLDALK
jgi:selenocysteine lyase/cysteine desulfurase